MKLIRLNTATIAVAEVMEPPSCRTMKGRNGKTIDDATPSNRAEDQPIPETIECFLGTLSIDNHPPHQLSQAQ
jgi:hypothetical protein